MSKNIVSIMIGIVGKADVLTGSAASERVSPWETHQPCHAMAIVRPSTTEQVAAIMQACHENDQSVVPYGGLTNLVQGCTTTPNDIALSFEKMNTIEEIDTTAHTMTVQAGVTMRAAQEKADAENLFFPVDIGARDIDRACCRTVFDALDEHIDCDGLASDHVNAELACGATLGSHECASCGRSMISDVSGSELSLNPL